MNASPRLLALAVVLVVSGCGSPSATPKAQHPGCGPLPAPATSIGLAATLSATGSMTRQTRATAHVTNHSDRSVRVGGETGMHLMAAVAVSKESRISHGPDSGAVSGGITLAPGASADVPVVFRGLACDGDEPLPSGTYDFAVQLDVDGTDYVGQPTQLSWTGG